MAQNNSTLYLLTYNNYYNRIVKREANISGYLTYSTYNPLTCNFNPADGIDTEHIFNVPYVANTPAADYCVVVDENNEIVSRWFIVQAIRTRGGQYRLSLHRDLLADYYDDVLAAPCYIERAMLNANSPFIFNSENMRFNQIKKKEHLLADKTNTPWIVGYLANNYSSAEGADPANIEATYVAENTVYPELSWKDYRIINTIYTGGGDQTLITRLRNIPDGKVFDIYQSGKFYYVEVPDSAYTNFFANSPANDTTAINTFISDYYNSEKFVVDLSIAGFTNTTPYMADISYLLSINNQRVRNTDYIAGQESTNGPEYFYVRLVPQGQKKKTTYLPVASAEYNRAKAKIQAIYNATNYASLFEFRNYSANGNTFAIETTLMEYKFGLSESPLPVGVKTSFVGLQGKEKAALIDAPYVMFATPYFDMDYTNSAGQAKRHNGEAGRNLSAEIIKRFSGGYAYDLQLLPYCPLPSLIESDGSFNMTTMSSNGFSTIFAGTEEVGFFVFPETSSFSMTIDLPEPVAYPGNAIDVKVDNETKFCRLVSPNYSGAFDFTPTKNGGFAQVEVNATYKPYQPYIQLAPVFNAGYLYGGDFNDNRGLICGGDFSLPQTSDAWITYQSQNKSYRESFNRQVENMETTYDINRQQMKTAGIINAFTAGISGGSSTGMSATLMGAGGPIGLAAGVGAGAALGVASGIGLAADLKAADALQKEALSYTGDQFNYNLQNIQALPTTMSRVSAFDINNKYFPFVEFYEATPDEETALRNKITYNSMSVMAIGTIGQYKQTDRTFIQGQIIRLESLGEDYHSAAAIAAEIQKGVYI